MKWVHQTTQAARYPEVVSMAFRKATSGRPGPVYIDCGADVLYEEIEEEDAVRPYRAERRTRPAAEAGVVKETIDMLAAAERPMIFAGGGAFFSGAADELTKFVDLTSTPFYTAPMSRGLVPEDHVVSFQAARSNRHARDRLRACRRYQDELDGAVRPPLQPRRQVRADRHRRGRAWTQPRHRPGHSRRRQGGDVPASGRGTEPRGRLGRTLGV